MHTVDLLLHGTGHVGRALLSLLERQAPLLAERHALAFRVVGAVDRGGAIWQPTGIPPAALLAAKAAHGSVAALPGGERGADVLALLGRAASPLTLLEATLVAADGGPGLAALRAALAARHSAVSANKGPLVVALPELEALAARHGGALSYSATVCGGLPALAVARDDLAHATITRMEGIVNSTTNYILTRMAAGEGYDEALRRAQADGIAEADPALDVSGWDAANKLLILAHAALRQPSRPADVRVEGIEGIGGEALRAAAARGEAIKLLARAERDPSGRYALSVGPRALPLDHPLARLEGHQMGLWLETDINGTLFLSIIEETPEPTAAAMLRDLVHQARGARR